jgi:hypothetical protein
MKRTHVNGLIDALAFAAFLFLLSTGMVLLYQLPPGSGGRQGFGTGHGASERSVQLLWGWTRHEWGQIHYWTAYVLMAVLAVHLFLHWKWIVSVVRGKPTNASPYRLVLGSAGLVSVVLLTAIPMASPTSAVRRSELQDRQMPQAGEPLGSQLDNRSSNGTGASNSESGDDSQSIRGSMTLQEISASSGMPVSEIVTKLGLPRDVDPNESAGRLLREHGLQMNDLRQVLRHSSSHDTSDSR